MSVVRPPSLQLSEFLLQPHSPTQSRPQVTSPHCPACCGVGLGVLGSGVSKASQPGPSSSSLPVVRAPRTQLSWFLLQPHGDVQTRPQVNEAHVASVSSVGLGVLSGSVGGSVDGSVGGVVQVAM